MKSSSYALWWFARSFRSKGVSGMIVAGARALGQIMKWPSRVVRARRDMSLLLSLSEHQLRDIGVAQHDLIAAANLPLGEDPSEFIARVVAERRRARIEGCAAVRLTELT